MENEEIKKRNLSKKRKYTLLENIHLNNKRIEKKTEEKQKLEQEEEKIRQVVQDIYDQSERLASGKPSPVFNNYENAKGGTTSLSDLKGKFVYVDVWATWCRPCIGEIPVLKELQNKFRGKNIEFVSISVDENREAWLKTIKEKELKGVQLLSDKSFNSQFIREYGITEIPVFILLDKEGKIINANAPRPSDPEIEKILENLIK